MKADTKWENLKTLLAGMKHAVLAYSGGVDSSLLLKAASEAMGPGLIAVTAVSETYPPSELYDAQEFAGSLGVTHKIIHTTELKTEEFVRNGPDRCYHCKYELFSRLKAIAESEGMAYVIDGSNCDDFRDYRPGRRAAEALGVRSPLVEAGFGKSDIRECAKGLGLPMWDKPSLACLSSRIPYGTRITVEGLDKVMAAEDVVRSFGFRQVRVRHYGDTARIEVDAADIGRMASAETRDKIVDALKDIGYIYVTLDLEGYRTGSMNDALKTKELEG